jgi:hypothetical protein
MFSFEKKIGLKRSDVFGNSLHMVISLEFTIEQMAAI